MKRMLTLALLLMLLETMAFAQEQDAWVGEWTSEAYTDMDVERSPKDSDGSFKSIVYTNFKKILKITKHGETYIVRNKKIKADDPSYVNYGLPMIVYSLEGNTMELRSYIEKDSFIVNGEVDEYSDITYYYRLTNVDGVLYYHYYKYYSVNYDKHMRYKDENDCYIPSTSPSSKLRFFNDNW